METFDWDPEKNAWLIKVRGVSFERVVFRVEHGGLLDIVAHPNRSRYPNQKILIVEMDAYAWLVPFVESADHYFLKTIIPSRKATRKYLEALR
ncbi:BrnT family toxin [Salinisphaera sp.]|uniref:BrnT family toxin n=1 Tax=Salinisphaera sp. TaxID=1914330 RepID=UPI000C3ED7CF|nr:BrnT family toxin [Salinisphaera sp.]MAS11029.1 toxin [Salinisphaera sp.]|tara:strand:- start:374 stop:652 length:279 start_codon:yes stop_codon:yes gene_type:complete